MDEPTAGLDPNQIVEVRKTLLRIAQEKTILLSTHILQEVEAMARRVIMIHEGRLVHDGPTQELMTKYHSLDKAFHSLTAAAPQGH
jgi:ABC-2 type transport system ATP-binding protein